MSINQDITNKLADRALLVYRDCVLGGEGQFSEARRAIEAYASAAGISYSEAYSATMEAYRTHFGPDGRALSAQ